MYAVVLYKNHSLVDLICFVRNADEYNAVCEKFAQENGGVEYLVSQGYAMVMELAC